MPDTILLKYAPQTISMFSAVILPIIALMVLAILTPIIGASIDERHTKRRIAVYTLNILFFASGITLACDATILLQTAKKCGAYQPLNEITVQKVITSTQLSPEEDTVPDETKRDGSVLLYYKFGCPDCEAVYEALKEKTKDNENIYWISTRSKNGKTWKEIHDIQEVPSGVYLKSDGTFTTLLLYTKDSDGNTILDEHNLNILLTLQQKDLESGNSTTTS